MGIKYIVGVAVMILVAAGSAPGQQPPYPGPSPQTVPAPQGMAPQGSPYADAPTNYQSPGIPSGGYQYRQPVDQPGANQAQWPQYPYPQYHNPYYQGSDPRAALNGTIDWLFSLPAVLMDRFSNVLDKNIFPRQPATSGGSTAPPVQGTPMNQLEPKPPAPVPQSGIHQRSVR